MHVLTQVFYKRTTIYVPFLLVGSYYCNQVREVRRLIFSGKHWVRCLTLCMACCAGNRLHGRLILEV